VVLCHIGSEPSLGVSWRSPHRSGVTSRTRTRPAAVPLAPSPRRCGRPCPGPNLAFRRWACHIVRGASTPPRATVHPGISSATSRAENPASTDLAAVMSWGLTSCGCRSTRRARGSAGSRNGRSVVGGSGGRGGGTHLACPLQEVQGGGAGSAGDCGPRRCMAFLDRTVVLSKRFDVDMTLSHVSITVGRAVSSRCSSGGTPLRELAKCISPGAKSSQEWGAPPPSTVPVTEK